MTQISHRDYRVTLTCGCTIRVRNQPLHAGVRYGCASGLGHGYALAWTAWERTDQPAKSPEEPQP